MPVEHDPRFEWIELCSASGEVVAVRSTCNHLTPVPVHSVKDELVAWLCPDCDKQLPAEMFTE